MERVIRFRNIWFLLMVFAYGCGGGPVINSFTSDLDQIESDQPLTLNWTTSSATTVSIEPDIGNVDVDGSLTLYPGETTNFILTATDSSTPPVSVTKELNIDVLSARSTVINALPNMGEAPLTVRFSPFIKTDSAINQYQWDFDGDGEVDVTDPVGHNVEYTYNQVGDYEVSLKAYDTLGNEYTASQQITVSNAAPVVEPYVSTNSPFVNTTVAISVYAKDSEGISSIEWDFDGDGSFDAIFENTNNNKIIHATKVHQYTSVGVFQPIVRATDKSGSSTTVSGKEIQITAVSPEGGHRITTTLTPRSNQQTAGDPPFSVNFTTSVSPSSTSIQTWAWDFDGDGTVDSNEPSPVNHTYTEGRYILPNH